MGNLIPMLKWSNFFDLSSMRLYLLQNVKNTLKGPLYILIERSFHSMTSDLFMSYFIIPNDGILASILTIDIKMLSRTCNTAAIRGNKLRKKKNLSSALL